MITEDEFEDTGLSLQMLSAMDPAGQANMMSHTVALRLMLTGQLHDEEVSGVMFGACFGITDEQEAAHIALTTADGADRFMIAFDVDDPAGPPIGYGLFHKEGAEAVLLGRCAPWTSADGMRTLLVAANDATDVGTFSYRHGVNLRRKPGVPSRDPEPGYRRARARMARLVASPRVRNAVGPIYMAVRGGNPSHPVPDPGSKGATPTRKPLPDDYFAHVFSAAEIMVTLRDQLGIQLREAIELNLQTLHDLVREHIAPEELEYVDQLIVVDDETAELLKDLMRRTVERLRPENRGVAHNVAVEARSVTLAKLDGDAPAVRSLTALEAALWARTGEAVVVLEDADFATYGAEMNRLISARPHGRSAVLD